MEDIFQNILEQLSCSDLIKNYFDSNRAFTVILCLQAYLDRGHFWRCSNYLPLVLIVRTLLFQKRVKFYWFWAGGLVLIVRTVCYSRNVLCFTGLGPEDRCSS
jgi:hypothetical protein